ncbi:sensor domain-containing diguanylate cyclase [Microvirga sp. CF3016]|uniref:sensor domain-containing diguanylate cyclase n=1 Tax=Microvirga sp. CF3016 TaxID=3110181 RepID=UPI002E76A32E|nr:sensor domain-containing diguanylate cyclase [Microvirga sp. CF3016]MEE1612905.1 sensor domain-containing diguanylate cyclase [Microvirga sp. CF3016]
MVAMRHWSLRQQVTLLVGVLCLALVCVLAAGAAYIAQSRVRQIVMSNEAHDAALTTSTLDRGMFERYREIRNLAAMPPLKDIWRGDPTVIRQVLEQLRTSYPDYAWIGYVTPEGTVRAATQGMLEGQSVQARPWFQDGLKGPAVGDVHEAKLLAALLGPGPNNEPFRFVDVAAPVRDESGRVVGVIGAHLSWTWAEERRQTILRSQARSNGKSIWILSGDGTMLLGPSIGSRPFTDEQIRAMRQARTGAFEDPSGPEPMLTGYAVADGYKDYPGLNWIVISRQPDSIAFAATKGIVWTIIGLGCVIALAGLICALFIARGVARPLQAIIQAADKIGRDPTISQVPRVTGSLEIIRLSAALRSLLRRAGAAEQQVIEVASQREKDVTALRQLAETDALSGLLNRRGFSLLADDAFTLSRRSERSLAVLLLDIDLFKRVNDTYGHAAGDAVIQAVGTVLTKALRSSDIIARFGGEEFIVLMHAVDANGIITVAQNLRRAIEALSIKHQDQNLSVTISVGGAMARLEDRDIQDVIERADGALYKAKAAGRNRVVVDGLQIQLATAVA